MYSIVNLTNSMSCPPCHNWDWILLTIYIQNIHHSLCNKHHLNIWWPGWFFAMTPCFRQQFCTPAVTILPTMYYKIKCLTIRLHGTCSLFLCCTCVHYCLKKQFYILIFISIHKVNILLRTYQFDIMDLFLMLWT